MKLYEAMFVVNSNAAKENYEKVEVEVFNCITRHGGEIVNSLKWDERRLAYEIKKQKRATFILVHFQAEGDAIAPIERQCQISEVILRVLITVDEDGPVCEPCPTGRDEFETGRPVREGRDRDRDHDRDRDRDRDRGPRREGRDRGPRREGRREEEDAGVSAAADRD